MDFRRPLRPNNQTYSPVSGSQWFAKFPKSSEKQSVVSWAKPGKGQQGESVTGAPYKSQVIRKGTTRAT